MRKPKTEPTINPDDLVTPFEGVASGCWGAEWQPGCHECNICADNATCSIIFNKKVEAEVLEFEINTFDRVNFKRIDKEQFRKDILSNPDYWDYEKLVNYVQEKASCRSMDMVKQWLIDFITEYNLESVL